MTQALGATFVAGAVQAAPAYMNLSETVDKTIGLIAQAASKDIELLVFPELWLPGYPWWVSLGSPTWFQKFVPTYFRNSLENNSPEMHAIRDAIKKAGINVVLGYSERAQGSLYISQAVLDREGEIALLRRKIKPTYAERMVFGEGNGAGLTVSDLDVARVGALNCWEHLGPLTKFALHAQFEQVHAASWPAICDRRSIEGRGVDEIANRAYAIEGQCFVAASTAVAPPSVIDWLCETEEQRQMIEPGGGKSAIYGPDGVEISTRLGPSEEGIVAASIDLEDIIYAKSLIDPVGHYSRPDILRLVHNIDATIVAKQHSSGPRGTQDLNAVTTALSKTGVELPARPSKAVSGTPEQANGD